MKRELTGLLSAVLCICLLAGCSEVAVEPVADHNNKTQTETELTFMEEQPVINYILPEHYASLILDREGYSQEDRKSAIVRGSSLPETVQVMEAVTDTVVCECAVESVKTDQSSGMETGVVYFDEVTADGTYYLQGENLGKSHIFSITTDLYVDSIRAGYTVFTEKLRNRQCTVEEIIGILEVYELYGDFFTDEDENTIPDLLEELKKWIVTLENDKLTEETSVAYSAMLAKYSYLYRNFQADFAKECMQRASTIYEENKPKDKQEDALLALTELYRVTGLATYSNEIVEYQTYLKEHPDYLHETYYLYATMNYLSTHQTTNTRLCEYIMNCLMQTAEGLAEEYRTAVSPTALQQPDVEALLQDAAIIAFANYINNNYQYTNIASEYMHYLCGKNAYSLNLYEGNEDKVGYMLLNCQLAGLHERMINEGAAR